MRCLAGAGTLALVVAATGCGEPTFDDPVSARCDSPAVAFGKPVARPDHREVDVRFTCEGAEQSGTLYEPKAAGRHAAVVWVHGAGQSARLPYVVPFITDLVRAGVAVLSFDKRGVQESEGECCPGDSGHLNLVTADVQGAVDALRKRPEIDGEEIGLIGASQAGWIAPRAALRAHAAFLALASAAVLTYGEVQAYAELTGGSESDDPLPASDEIERTLADAGPSGFDPKPDIEQLTVPALWLFGSADREVPVPPSVAFLRKLKRSGSKFTIVTFEGAGHGLLDTPPTDPGARATLVHWILRTVGERAATTASRVA
jgi:pimeloyl-ACP methyl ester carboxylesterase